MSLGYFEVDTECSKYWDDARFNALLSDSLQQLYIVCLVILYHMSGQKYVWSFSQSKLMVKMKGKLSYSYS